MHKFKTHHNNTHLPDKNCFLDYDSFNKPPLRHIKILVGETPLCNLVTSFLNVVYPKEILARQPMVEYRHLEIGDFCFVDADHDEEVIIVGERKEIHDLSSSIIDGRAKDQSTNMLNMLDRGSILWIIEGSPMSAGEHGVGKKALYGKIDSIVSKMQNDVVMVDSMQATAVQLINFQLRMSYCDKKKWAERKLHSTKTVFLNTVKNKRAHRLENKFMYMLLAVEDVSVARAESICRVYPSFTALMQGYRACIAKGDNPNHMLRHIHHDSLNSSEIGHAVSRNVAEHFEVHQWLQSEKRASEKRKKVDEDDDDGGDHVKTSQRPHTSNKRKKVDDDDCWDLDDDDD